MKEPDYLYWTSLSEWPRWKAACLLSGGEPVSEDEFASRIRSEPEWLPARFYEAIKDANADGGLPYRSVGGKKMYTRVPSRQCVAWAIKLPWLNGHAIPAPLAQMLSTPATPAPSTLKPLKTVDGSNAPALLPGSFKFDKPDWEKWKRIDVTRLWKAACLAANIEPSRTKSTEIWSEVQLSSFPPEFHTVWEAVNCDEALSRLEYLPGSGRMLWKTHLPGFAKWAIEKGLPVALEMHEIAARLNVAGSSAVDFRTAVIVGSGVTQGGSGGNPPAKWWHEYDPLEMAKNIAKRMRNKGEFVATGKDAGKISAVQIYKEISTEITEREKRRAIKASEHARSISYKTIETYLKEQGFDLNR